MVDLITGDFGALDLMTDLRDDRDDLEMNLLQDEAMTGDEQRWGEDLAEPQKGMLCREGLGF